MSAPPASVTPVHGSGIAFRLRHSSRFGMAALRRLRPFDASGPDFTRQPLTAWRQKSRLNPREAHRTVVSALETDSSCTGQLAQIRARRSSGGRHLLRGSQSAKIHTQRANWPSIRLRQEFVRPARRWWPSTEPSMGSLAALTAGLGAQASEGTSTGVSDCVLGSTARDISGPRQPLRSSPITGPSPLLRAAPSHERPVDGTAAASARLYTGLKSILFPFEAPQGGNEGGGASTLSGGDDARIAAGIGRHSCRLCRDRCDSAIHDRDAAGPDAAVSVQQTSARHDEIGHG